jgi:hypothetical protein
VERVWKSTHLEPCSDTLGRLVVSPLLGVLPFVAVCRQVANRHERRESGIEDEGRRIRKRRIKERWIRAR